jgi:hypothetical protein
MTIALLSVMWPSLLHLACSCVITNSLPHAVAFSLPLTMIATSPPRIHDTCRSSLVDSTTVVPVSTESQGFGAAVACVSEAACNGALYCLIGHLKGSHIVLYTSIMMLLIVFLPFGRLGANA